MTTIDEALAAARASGVDRLDAALLLAHRLGRDRAWLIAHGDELLDAAAALGFEADCRRRLDDVPLAYLVGERDFFGLRLRVSPAVLVPRPDTETLVRWALELIDDGSLHELPHPAVIDLGTGSGAIALALAANCPRARVTATDISAAALQLARANGARLGLNVQWSHGDWWAAVGAGRFDLAVANPPYVVAQDRHLAALRHEPQDALVAAEAGLAEIRRIVDAAPRHVTGWLLVEHGWDQAVAVRGLLQTAGGRDVQTRLDLAGQPRCSGALFGREG
jgi:release factor glutamine methyltransferase